MSAQVELTERAAEAAGAVDAGLGLNPLVGLGAADLIGGIRQICQHTLQHPWATLEYQHDLANVVLQVWTGSSNFETARGDRRFADPMWDRNPVYRAIHQAYLAWRDSLDRWVAGAGFDRVNEQRVRIALSQFGDALAPTNSWFGNPAAIRKCIETGGMSAAHGIRHMFDDWLWNGGLPSQVDKHAFRVGKNLGTTPGAVVFRNEQAELIHYAPKSDQVLARPLLIVPPQINKYYLFDLAPGRSIIEYLLANGIQVFVVSWRNPTTEQRDWGLDTYVKALIEITNVVRTISNSEDLNIAAACSGGITASILLGHFAAKQDRRINAVTLLVTVLDTSAESQLGHLITAEGVEAARAASHYSGVLQGEELGRIFAWMRPNDLIWNYWVNNYLLGNDPPAFDLLYWNADTTRLPARLHSDFLDLILHNPLPHPGALRAAGTPIDLSQITCDSFIVAGNTDHITPWQACYATTHMLGGAREFVLSSSGHIQSVINPPGNAKAKYLLNPQLPMDPEVWLAEARGHGGSWWDHWRDWLVARSGQWRPVPTTLGNPHHPPLVDAPGTYIFSS
jgi:poly[(R)-3-hydroxyalkanoate] polymerase subunit PhaC